MAKYAQGYERKNSDTKNLIILFSAIAAAILVAILIVILYNNFWKKPTKTLDDYTTYQITDYSEVLLQDEVNYVVYVYDSSDTSDTNASTVMSYIASYESGKTTTKLYLIDSYKFLSSNYSSSDDYYETAEENEEAIEKAMANYDGDLAEGYLFSVIDNDFTNSATQLATGSTTSSKTVKDILNNLKNNKSELGLLK